MRGWAARHPVAVQITIAAVVATAYVSGMPFGLVDVPLAAANAMVLVNILFATGLCIGLMRWLFPAHRFGFRAEGLARGLAFGWPALVAAAVLFSADAVPLWPFTAPASADRVVLWLVVYNLLVALVEETFARGVLLVALVTAFADRRHGTLIAVILSSAVFGLGHVPGMLGYPWWLVAAKVLWATALGVFLAAVYLRSGNLWSTVILHALLNIAAGAAVFLSPLAEPFSTAGVTLLVCVGLGVFGLFLLRRRDPAAVR